MRCFPNEQKGVPDQHVRTRDPLDHEYDYRIVDPKLEIYPLVS
jgi:hypothetical protein